ncbi:hypothetical protein [Streptomyces sp. NBC_00306]|uniref:hypothetical protein n=1 Tax=Streptomyces sp. NBC_00306 TaxID=2975708 RepID=UPI002E2C26DE|nr:hypothetical protein [Streptomyces sp. NBC_00306]
MRKSTDAQPPENWCAWGDHWTTEPVETRHAERQSGPPVTISQCDACARPRLEVAR